MSAKNLDKHNRWRNKAVFFRVSPEEDAQIETAVKLTGLTKQDYIIRRLLCRDVVVQGNPRVYKALRDQLVAVLDELRRIEAGQGVNEELLDTIQMITTIMKGMQEDKTVHNQLSAIFNHAARFYGLNLNPARQAGNMGAEERKEMLFWTREEYTKFSEAMMDKPLSFYAFEVLYWCGVREGELLALTPADFDFEKRTLTINKSYQRINKQDVITTPKTPKSNRVIQMPQFLCDELQDYLKQLYGVEPDSRMFPISKSYLHREMDRGCKQTGVKRIRIHDLRHSHISLLIDMGFTALAIAERVGHESIDITYRYAHLFPTRQVEMADKLDSLKNEKGV